MFDVALNPRVYRRCDGLGRRDFLRVGGLSVLGLSLSQLLKSEASAAAIHSSAAKARSVILVFLGGGISHHDSFDMKPDAPAEVRGQFRPSATNVPGTMICEHLPRMARIMDRVALVRSGAHQNNNHEIATNWVLSGRFGSGFGDFPAMGAVVSHEKGFTGVLPPYVAVPQNPSFSWELGKSAFLGGRYESFKTGDPNAANFRVRDISPGEPISARRLERRQSLLAAVDGLARQVHGSDQIATYDEFRGRAASMILSPETQRAFGIDDERPELRDRYGRTTFGQSCLLARRLIEHDVRFVTINAAGWDHHAKIFQHLEKKLPEFDQGLSALIEDMTSRGLLDQTLVVVFGEFGRTPKINKDVGRDHWEQAASLLFAGAGVQGGKVIGATDKQGAQVTTKPTGPADVAATIYGLLGIDPQKMLTEPDGRQTPILDKGEFIGELFG
ncbi:MAG TPA: DUF1501 domain-containing protein [Pirellulales bacterium]|jgi:hypothetical protein|nr:DUF1501 domain-containing protein [Pirellulales bacterium]